MIYNTIILDFFITYFFDYVFNRICNRPVVTNLNFAYSSPIGKSPIGKKKMFEEMVKKVCITNFFFLNIIGL